MHTTPALDAARQKPPCLAAHRGGGVKIAEQLVEPRMRPLKRTHRAGSALPQPKDRLPVAENVGRDATLAPPAAGDIGVDPGKKGLDKHEAHLACDLSQTQGVCIPPCNFKEIREISLMTTRLKSPTILSERVKARLDALGLSAMAAAKLAGKGETFVRDIIRLRVRSPGAEALSDLARALQCSVTYLLGQSEEIGAPPSATAPVSLGRYMTAPLMIAHDVAAGRWNEVDDLMQVEPEQSPLASDPQWPAVDQYAARVVGPSMNEFYPPGTFVRLVSIHALKGYVPATGDHVEVLRRRDGGSLLEYTLKEVVVAGDGTIELACRSTDPKFAQAKIPYRDGVSPDDEGAEISIRGLVTGDFRPRPVRR